MPSLSGRDYASGRGYKINKARARIVDTFDDINGIALASHVPNLNFIGGPWRQNSGTWTIDSSGHLTASAVNQSSADIDSGIADAEIEARFVTVVNNDAGLVARVTDDNNYLLMAVNSIGGIVAFYKREAGGFTQIGINTPISWANGDLIMFRVVGNRLEAYQNGVLVYNVTDSTYISQTRHGVRSHVVSGLQIGGFIVRPAVG